MNEYAPINQERIALPSIEEVYQEIYSLAPKPVEAFVPQNADEQKKLFLSDSIKNPTHTYDRLENLHPETSNEKIHDLTDTLPMLLDTNSIDYIAYAEYAKRFTLVHELLQAAKDTHSPDEELASAAGDRFMELNKEIYGEPNEGIYRSLLGDTVRGIDSKNLSEDMLAIKSELDELLPAFDAEVRRFKPSNEAITRLQGIADYLYGGMFEHIPKEQELFNPEEIATVFRGIIETEFGEAAQDWKVIVTKAASINVVAGDKLIKIPENRKPVTDVELRGLIAHELGIHMLRSITGEDTDLPILKTGLSDYYDAEEGLGKMMEQAVKGEYVESGVPYYTVAGLMYFDQKDFRETHEIMWRLNYLKKSEDGEEVSEEKIATTKAAAYKTVLRMTRGTDKFPWFKDLAYYNGALKMWEYSESASEDAEKFTLLLIGKADVTNDLHRRIVLETKSI